MSSTNNTLKIAVLISGAGRSLQNLIEYEERTGSFKIALVGSNRECSGLQFAQDKGITIWTGPTLGQEICFAAWCFQIDVICLAGFLKKVYITPKWKNKVINIHPSLLPKGQGMYGMEVHEKIIADKEEFSGCTVHFCDNEYDTGPIILQSTLKVDSGWDASNLAEKVFELEKKSFPLALESYRHCCNNKLVDVNEMHQYIARSLEENDNESDSGICIPSTTEVVK